MRTELSAGPFTVCAYSALFVAIGVAGPFVDPIFLFLSVFFIPLGLSGFSFWRVFVDESGFVVERRGREVSFDFDQVKSVSEGALGLPHLVLVLDPNAPVRRVRFMPEPSHGTYFFRNHRLKRQIEGIIESSRREVREPRAT